MATQTQAPERLVTAAEAAVILGVSPITLAQWRWRPRVDIPPPPYLRISGRAIRYKESALMAWIAERAAGTKKNVASPRKAK